MNQKSEIHQIWYAAGNDSDIWIFPDVKSAREKAEQLANAVTNYDKLPGRDFYLGSVETQNFPIIKQTKTIHFSGA